MDRIVECVPNFSEGRDRRTIDAIASAISSVDGVELLDVDPGVDTNRTVMTFAGSPEAVSEAAFAAIAKASEFIDMRKHKGAHARIGACDVCPFVPVSGITLEECALLARQLGERVAEKLHIPVYLYGAAATRPERRNLAEVRRGEYESIPSRIGDPYWEPDFGTLVGCEKTGACIIGARRFLIAYNFNLNTRDRRIAHDIALDIREQGRALRDKQGRIVRYKNGRPRRKPGRFKNVKAVGWYLEQYGLAQVSMNLTDYEATPLADVFEEVCRQAERRGVRCTGSELVGLAPKECLLEAGRHFLRKAGKTTAVPESELIHTAVRSLGLDELYPFKPEKKIIEYRLSKPKPFLDGSLTSFVDVLSQATAVPGGGSAAALTGSMAAALASMVAGFAFDEPGKSDRMEKAGRRAQQIKTELLELVQADSAAYEAVLQAMRLKKTTEEEKEKRRQAIEQAMWHAARVPASTLEKVKELAVIIEEVFRHGKKSTLTDAAVAAACARAAAEGAYLNVEVNLSELGKGQNQLSRSSKKTLEKVCLICERLLERAKKQISS